MTQTNSTRETPVRRFRFLGVFARWLRKVTAWRRSPKRERVRPRPEPLRQGLSMESLEQRTTISDALLGFVWPALLGAPAFAPRPAAAQGDVAPGRAQGLNPAVRDTPAPPPFAVIPAAETVLTAAGEQRIAAAFGPRHADASRGEDLFAPVPPAFSRTGRIRPRFDAAVASAASEGGVRTTPDQVRVAAAPAALPQAPSGATLSTFPPGTADSLVTLAGSLREDPGGVEVQSGAWQVSWQAGAYDPYGQFMGATELMHLVGYQGSLFAGTSVFRSLLLGDPRVGAQVLRLDSPEGEWVVEKHFDEILPENRARYERLESLKVVTFTTDGKGQLLKEPVSLLLASPTDATGLLAVYSRDDATQTWTEMVLGQSARGAQTRSFGFHRDQVTGVDRVFAGTNAGLYGGVYDPTVPGNIRWDEQPELYHESRVMAFAEANGALHAVMRPEMYVRVDGPRPYWVLVMEYPMPPPIREGLRGLTTIPSPDGFGEEILASLETNPGFLVRIQPSLGYQYVIELDPVAFLREQWGEVGYESAAAAYNDMPRVVDPETGEPVHLIGLMPHPPVGQPRRSSWYLIRHAGGAYDLREIPALPHPIIQNPVLFANRTIAVSPFKEDAGQYLYFGGYDTLFLPARNTAWIYRIALADALRG